MVNLRLLPLSVCVAVTACGGGSPNAPSPAEPSGLTLRGETVNALDGVPIGRLTVKLGSQTTVSDDNGRFELQNLREGQDTIVISGASIVERQRSVTIPANSSRDTLIPASFDLTAFDQMIRGAGELQRWTGAPALVVLAKVMNYERFAAGDQYHATSQQLTEEELTQLIEHLTEGLAFLTGNTFTEFSSVSIENPGSGARVNTLRTGTIVVGRYKGVQSLANTIGFGRWATNDASEVIGGAMYLDSQYDSASQFRRLLRIHELGHALGYQHVTSRRSIMNPAIGPEPTEFDRQAALVAFQRLPGNQSPDSDIATRPRRPGGIFGVGSPGRVNWWEPVTCGADKH